MKSKKKWSFEVQCKECGSYLECELEDISIEPYSGIRLVQCCDCDSPVGVDHVKFPNKMERKIHNSPVRSKKVDYSPLFEGVRVLTEEEEAKIIARARAGWGN
jgi:hypothetical protein